MPAASETVPNRPLDMSELRQLLEKDFTRLLDGHSILASPMAFGRVSYRITLVITSEQGENYDIFLDSRSQPQDKVRNQESLAAVTAHPMPNQTELTKTLTRELQRNISSPNRERLREGLPVPVEVKNRDGGTRTEAIQYHPDPTMAEDVRITGDDLPPIEDIPEEYRQRLAKIKEEAEALVAEEQAKAVVPEATDEPAI